MRPLLFIDNQYIWYYGSLWAYLCLAFPPLWLPPPPLAGVLRLLLPRLALPTDRLTVLFLLMAVRWVLRLGVNVLLGLRCTLPPIERRLTLELALFRELFLVRTVARVLLSRCLRKLPRLPLKLDCGLFLS